MQSVPSTPEQVKQEILRILAAPKYRPLEKIELAKVLGRKSGERMNLNQILRELERAGEIARIRKNRYAHPRLTSSREFCISIKPATPFFPRKTNRARRTFSLPRKIPAP